MDYKELEQRIDEAMMEYRKENRLSAGKLSSQDWMKIYKEAGMTDKEIEQYRQEMRKYSKATNDPLDAYRD